MDIKIFKNKNINIKIKDVKNVNKNNISEYIYNSLLDNNFSIPYDSGCMGNYDMFDTLYNYDTNGVYIILHSNFDDLRKGKTVKLYYSSPTAEDIDIIENQY